MTVLMLSLSTATCQWLLPCVTLLHSFNNFDLNLHVVSHPRKFTFDLVNIVFCPNNCGTISFSKVAVKTARLHAYVVRAAHSTNYHCTKSYAPALA